MKTLCWEIIFQTETVCSFSDDYFKRQKKNAKFKSAKLNYIYIYIVFSTYLHKKKVIIVLLNLFMHGILPTARPTKSVRIS